MGEVFAEATGHEELPVVRVLASPRGIVNDGIAINRFFRTTMHAQVRLLVADQAERGHLNRRRNGVLDETAWHSIGAEWGDLADVNGNHASRGHSSDPHFREHPYSRFLRRTKVPRRALLGNSHLSSPTTDYLRRAWHP